MPQTPLESRSGSECQSQWLWEGSVTPTQHSGHCSRHWHDPESARNTHQHPKMLLLREDFVLEAFTRSMPGQFQGAWWFWVDTGLGLKPHRVPPALPCSLTCKSSLGSLSAAARVALGSQWWIRDTWSQPGLPGATRRLTPATGEEEKRKKLVFLGHAHDSASC